MHVPGFESKKTKIGKIHLEGPFSQLIENFMANQIDVRKIQIHLSV